MPRKLQTMRETISKLSTPAFVGNTAALSSLIDIAEASYSDEPSISAEAYREVAAAYRHKAFVIEAKAEALQSEIETLRRFKGYVEAHKFMLEVKTVVPRVGPAFSEFSHSVEKTPSYESVLTPFSNHYRDREQLAKMFEDASVSEEWNPVFAILKKMAYAWIISQYSEKPADEESQRVLDEVAAYFDPSVISDLQFQIEVWPLTKMFRKV